MHLDRRSETLVLVLAFWSCIAALVVAQDRSIEAALTYKPFPIISPASLTLSKSALRSLRY